MILTLARKDLHTLFAAPSTWVMLALLQFILGWFFLARLDDYLQVQAQLAQMDNAPGATISIAAPLSNLLALLLLMLTPLFSMRLIAEERRNQTWPLLASAPLSSTSIVLGKFLGLVLLLWLAVLSSVAMMTLLLLGTQADLGLILSNLLGLALLAAAFAALGLYISALSRQPVVAAFGALALSVALWLLDMSSGALRALSPIAHFQNLNSGLISTADLVYFIAFSVGFLLLTIHHLRRERGGH